MHNIIDMKSTDHARPAGQRRYVTMLFNDLCESTRLASQLDAETYADTLEAIQGAAIAVIRQNEYPRPRPRDRYRCRDRHSRRECVCIG